MTMAVEQYGTDKIVKHNNHDIGKGTFSSSNITYNRKFHPKRDAKGSIQLRGKNLEF